VVFLVFLGSGPQAEVLATLGATSTFTIGPPRIRCTLLALTLLRRVAFGILVVLVLLRRPSAGAALLLRRVAFGILVVLVLLRRPSAGAALLLRRVAFGILVVLVLLLRPSAGAAWANPCVGWLSSATRSYRGPLSDLRGSRVRVV
jgi:hypothetical protein